MGMYTELILGCGFKKSIPQDLVYTIATLAEEVEILNSLPKDCKMLFNSRNPLTGDCYSFVPVSTAKFWYDDIANCYYLASRSAIKNYDHEIQKFLELIKPYIDQGSGALDTYAYVHYEEAEQATIYSLHDEEEQ